MKINGTSNNSLQNKVLLDTFIEQISALQTDVGNLQIADNNMAQAIAAKANTVDIASSVATGTLDAQNGNIKTLKVQGTGSGATIENAAIGTASIGTETVASSHITELQADTEVAGTIRTGTLIVDNDTAVGGNLAVQDVSAKDVTSASVNTLNLTAAEADINKVEAQTAEVTNKLTVNDLEVSGAFTGVAHLETESVEADSVKADEIEATDVLKAKNIRDWVTQVMNQDMILNPPTPALGNVDTYTIELPRFDGTFLLSWEDEDVVWSATVIGNGKTYGISWGSRTETNYITDLFQYNGKVYIRVISNGKLKYCYATTKDLGDNPITIYRNMNGWVPEKSLEQLCDDRNHIINTYSSGTVWFGPVTIPMLETDGSQGLINFMGSTDIAHLPNLETEVKVGDVWNITDEGYTNRHFVEGSGKPINAGDDVIAVDTELDYEGFETYNLPELEEGHKFGLVHKFGDTVLAFEVFRDESIAYPTSITRVWRKEDDEFVVVSENTNPPGCNPSLGTSQPRELWPAEGVYTLHPSYYNGRILLFGAGGAYNTFACIYSDDYGETWHHDTYGSTYRDGGNYATQLADGTIVGLGSSGYLYKSTDNGETFDLHWVPHPDWGQEGDIVVNGDLFEESTELRSIYPIGSIKNRNSPYYGAAVAIPLSTSYEPGRLIYSYDGIEWDILEYNDSYTYFDTDQNTYFLDELPNGDLLIKKATQWPVSNITYEWGCTSDTVQRIIKLEDVSTEEEDEYYQYTDLIDIQGEGLDFCWTAIKNDEIYSSVGSVSKDNGRTWHYVEDARTHIPSGEDPDDYDTPYPQAVPYVDGNDVVFLNTFSGQPESYSKSIRKQLAWDKFAAGVNYENFVAEKITATDDVTTGKVNTDEIKAISDKVTLSGDLQVTGELIAGDDVIIAGDLHVNGVEHINDTETAQTTDNYLVLRHNKTTPLTSSEHAGIAVHNYAVGKTATLTTDYNGTWRVADNTETSTNYTNISNFNNVYYTGLSRHTTSVIKGIKSAFDEDEFDECVYYVDSYYHYNGSHWFPITLTDNHLTLGAEVTDAETITDLESLIKHDLVYFRSLTITAINLIENEPLLTRDEASNMTNKALLQWDATGTKAKTIAAPTAVNQILTTEMTPWEDPINAHVVEFENNPTLYSIYPTVVYPREIPADAHYSPDFADWQNVRRLWFYSATTNKYYSQDLDTPGETGYARVDEIYYYQLSQMWSWHAGSVSVLPEDAVRVNQPHLSHYTREGIPSELIYSWKLKESGGLAFVGTRAEYNAAKLIPEGSVGHIPSGALVCITDESDYVLGENR